ncbi:LysR family transcriptional regulator [Stutzerimonas tarimensis]|uniref:LysR family transcriptional regulator n=1 Tax=Stutzerimonas tarimensis TaxID=1507735 RepID=A0ABV7TB49_9GAMM
MNLRDIDLNLMVVFNQLLIDRRVSIAADNLGLTQPAMSNALKRLRSTLNDELFVRTHQGMEPTPYAQQLAEPVALAIQTLGDAFRREDQFDPATAARTFTIAMTDIGEIYFLPPLMEALAVRAPLCTVSTVRGNAVNLAELLQSGAVDLAVGLLPYLQAGFFQRRLFEHRYVCLCRRGHPVTLQPLSLASFCQWDHVRVIASNTGHGEADSYMQRANIERRIKLEVPHFVAVGHILQHSDMLATVPQRFADSCVAPFDLVSTPLPFELPEININLFWHAKFNKDPTNRWLRALMVELFSDEPTGQ